MSVPEDTPWESFGIPDPDDDPVPGPDDVAELASKLAVELDVSVKHLAHLIGRTERLAAAAHQVVKRLRATDKP
jgi:hypothetical protein